ncbi:hypothetical protein HDU93_001843 [Gonapodya sp. JEL0774]|nr:hypothetical protein HDU93_001843 [Gonapodya sp. JEL0774]
MQTSFPHSDPVHLQHAAQAAHTTHAPSPLLAALHPGLAPVSQMHARAAIPDMFSALPSPSRTFVMAQSSAAAATASPVPLANSAARRRSAAAAQPDSIHAATTMASYIASQLYNLPSPTNTTTIAAANMSNQAHPTNLFNWPSSSLTPHSRMNRAPGPSPSVRASAASLAVPLPNANKSTSLTASVMSLARSPNAAPRNFNPSFLFSDPNIASPAPLALSHQPSHTSRGSHLSHTSTSRVNRSLMAIAAAVGYPTSIPQGGGGGWGGYRTDGPLPNALSGFAAGGQPLVDSRASIGASAGGGLNSVSGSRPLLSQNQTSVPSNLRSSRNVLTSRNSATGSAPRLASSPLTHAAVHAHEAALHQLEQQLRTSFGGGLNLPSAPAQSASPAQTPTAYPIAHARRLSGQSASSSSSSISIPRPFLPATGAQNTSTFVPAHAQHMTPAAYRRVDAWAALQAEMVAATLPASSLSPAIPGQQNAAGAPGSQGDALQSPRADASLGAAGGAGGDGIDHPVAQNAASPGSGMGSAAESPAATAAVTPLSYAPPIVTQQRRRSLFFAEADMNANGQSGNTGGEQMLDMDLLNDMESMADLRRTAGSPVSGMSGGTGGGGGTGVVGGIGGASTTNATARHIPLVPTFPPPQAVAELVGAEGARVLGYDGQQPSFPSSPPARNRLTSFSAVAAAALTMQKLARAALSDSEAALAAAGLSSPVSPTTEGLRDGDPGVSGGEEDVGWNEGVVKLVRGLRKWKKRSRSTVREARIAGMEGRGAVDLPPSIHLSLLQSTLPILVRTVEQYRHELGPKNRITLRAERHLLGVREVIEKGGVGEVMLDELGEAETETVGGGQIGGWKGKWKEMEKQDAQSDAGTGVAVEVQRSAVMTGDEDDKERGVGVDADVERHQVGGLIKGLGPQPPTRARHMWKSLRGAVTGWEEDSSLLEDPQNAGANSDSADDTALRRRVSGPRPATPPKSRSRPAGAPGSDASEAGSDGQDGSPEMGASGAGGAPGEGAEEEDVASKPPVQARRRVSIGGVVGPGAVPSLIWDAGEVGNGGPVMSRSGPPRAGGRRLSIATGTLQGVGEDDAGEIATGIPQARPVALRMTGRRSSLAISSGGGGVGSGAGSVLLVPVLKSGATLHDAANVLRSEEVLGGGGGTASKLGPKRHIGWGDDL